MDSDVRCNPVDSIGSSTESRVSHSEPRFLLGFQGTKTARREGKSSPFSDAGCCTSRQNSGYGISAFVLNPHGWSPELHQVDDQSKRFGRGGRPLANVSNARSRDHDKCFSHPRPRLAPSIAWNGRPADAAHGCHRPGSPTLPQNGRAGGRGHHPGREPVEAAGS